MKKLSLVLSLFVAAALVLAGCGKSAEQKKMENDLNAQVKALHDGQMAKMTQVKDLMAKLGEVTAKHEELAAKFPKETAGHTLDDLKAAKEKLATYQTSMETWMKGFKPYVETIPHEQAMQTLKKDVEDLTKAKASLDEALASATTALEGHSKFADELMAKVAKKGKK